MSEDRPTALSAPEPETAPETETETETAPVKPDVGAEHFFAVDLRVGTVIAVEPFPEARRPAWKLTVDFGPAIGPLRTSAQVTNYGDEDLVGRQVVGALNLGPRRIAGFVSQFLVLGGLEPDGTIHLLAPDAPLPPGAPVA